MPESEKTTSHTPRVIAWLLIAAFGILAALSLNNSMFYSPDSANYLGWATSLASFEGFTLNYGPEPTRYVANAPMYPILLSPVARFFPMNVIAAKALTLCFGVVLLILFYRYASARTGATAAAIALLFLVVNPEMMLFSTQILSDVPFAVVLMLVLIVVSRLTKEPTPPGWLFWTLPILLACAVLLRVIGFGLFAAVVLFFALRKDYARAGFLFLLPLAAYLVWYVRNDVVIANAELPQLQNPRLFLSHVLTSDAETPLAELVARVQHSLSFYTIPAGSSLFTSQYVGWLFAVVDFRDPGLGAVQSIIEVVQWPVAIGTFLVFAYGLKMLRKTDPAAQVMIIFLIFYAGIILLYPINDTRFLFPVLLLMALGLAASVQTTLIWLQKRTESLRPATYAGGAVCLLLLLCPSLIWSSNYLATTTAFKSAPEKLNTEIGHQVRYPIEYTKLFPQVGAWITAQGGSSGVVLSRYREAAIWLPGWKVFTPDPLIAPGDFDMIVRDYGCSYIIAHMASHQLRDFEFQMAVSPQFWFEPVFRAGDVEVLMVHPRNELTGSSSSPVVSGSDTTDRMRQMLLRGIRLMQSQDYTSARMVFERLKGVDGYEESGIFYTAVAAEFSQRLDEARKLFDELRAIPQTGTFLKQAQAHESIIDLLDSAAHASSREEQASFYHSVSLSYWLLGFRPQAESMMRNCMAADSTYFIGPLFAALYALERADIAAAGVYAARAQQFRPEEPLSRSLLAVVAAAREHNATSSPRRKASFDIAMGEEFVKMGLIDFAIEPLVEATRLDTSNTRALQMLSQLYIRKRRMFPARRILERLIAIEPSNDLARDELKQISAI